MRQIEFSFMRPPKADIALPGTPFEMISNRFASLSPAS